jgi:hypothetical protein
MLSNDHRPALIAASFSPHLALAKERTKVLPLERALYSVARWQTFWCSILKIRYDSEKWEPIVNICIALVEKFCT